MKVLCHVQSSLWSALRWRHNELDGVSDHQPHDCLLNRLFGRRSKKTSKLHVTGLCAGNSPGTGEFPAQKASNAENVSIWWRHHGLTTEHHRSALPKFDYNLESNIGFFMRPVCDIVCRHRNSSTVHADFLTHNGAWSSTDTILTLTRKSVISIFGFVISDFEHINTDPTMIYLRFSYWNCDSLWTATSAQRGCLIPRPITLFACFNFLPTGINITNHYDDVIKGAMASQITSLTFVYSTVYSGADQRKHQSSASLAFVRGIHRGSVNSPYKWPVTRKMFSFDDVIMLSWSLAIEETSNFVIRI